MSAQALVVTSDLATMDRWSGLLRARGIEPVCCATVEKARWLAEVQPIALALVEWDAVEGPRLLGEMFRSHGAVRVIVVGAGCLASEVEVAHAEALVHFGDLGSLGSRIDRIMGRCLGDLALRDGVVVHLSSGEVFTHPIGAKLILAPHRTIHVDRVGGDAMALSRLRRWLTEVGSVVGGSSVRGCGEHRMVVADCVRSAA